VCPKTIWSRPIGDHFCPEIAPTGVTRWGFNAASLKLRLVIDFVPENFRRIGRYLV
jgi:hypothetical protein